MEPADAEDGRGAPIGRRVVLGMLGLGALGIVAGSPASNAINEVAAKDPTGLAQLLPAGGGFRYYSIAGPVKRVTPAEYVLSVGGLVDQPVTLSYADLAAMPQTAAHPGLPVRHRVAGASGALERRAAARRARSGQAGGRGQGAALHVVRRCRHGVPHLRAGTA